VRDTTMTTQLLKIGAQAKIKHALSSVVELDPQSKPEEITRNISFSKSMGKSVRSSYNNLSFLSLANLEKDKETAARIAKVAEEEGSIIKRCDLIEKKIEAALGDDADVAVNVWNPWPWTEVLDKIASYYGATCNHRKENMDVFVAVFDKIDSDGGGTIDQDEMFEALTDAGLDISEEGVLTLVAMIDVDGNGEIDRAEWKETIEFYLELEEEEEERRKQEKDPAAFMNELRAKKLKELANSRSDRLLYNEKRKKGTAPTVMVMEKVEEGVMLGKTTKTMEKVGEGIMEKLEEGMQNEDEDDAIGLDISDTERDTINSK